jgi:hypothetical protein
MLSNSRAHEQSLIIITFLYNGGIENGEEKGEEKGEKEKGKEKGG